MTFLEEYQKIKNNASEDINNCIDSKSLNDFKIKYLGRKGLIADLFKKINTVPPDGRPQWGKKLNELKTLVDSDAKDKEREIVSKHVAEEAFDPTLPTEEYILPNPHPLTQVLKEIIDVFSSMGFGIAYGPEIEKNYYNFTALNFPEDHPARDMHDTFYIKENDLLLRTHTSPVQVRMMEKYDPPYKFIAPGKCYRRDTIDASHSPVFHQVEGLMVDEHISFADLKGILDEFAKQIFFPAQ